MVRRIFWDYITFARARKRSLEDTDHAFCSSRLSMPIVTHELSFFILPSLQNTFLSVPPCLNLIWICTGYTHLDRLCLHLVRHLSATQKLVKPVKLVNNTSRHVSSV